MKKFFTSVPLQVKGGLGKYRYKAEDSALLQTGFETAFPITAAINGYVKEGEAFKVVVIDPGAPVENIEALKREISELCAAKRCPEAEFVVVRYDVGEGIKSQVALLSELIANIEQNDELFCCITYGVKPQSVVMLTAIQCGYQMRKNTTIDCVVYGEIRRPANDPATWTAHIYDMTAIAKMNDVVRLLANSGAADPDAVLSKLFEF